MTEPTDGRDDYGRLAPLFAELRAMADGDPRREALRERLVREHLPIAHNIARRFARRGEPLSDLEQVATVGLIQAVDRFDPDHGSEFLSFAVPTITGEVRRYFRDHGWATRVPRRLKELHLTLTGAVAELSQHLGRAPTPRELAQHLHLPIEDVYDGLSAAQAYRSRSLDRMLDNENARPLSAGEIGHFDAELQQLEDREALAPLLAALPHRERTIISLRFFGNQTQTQIAKQLGISQMHVSRLLGRTLRQLREQLREG
jgi:RNA polymerase sigma-B factor